MKYDILSFEKTIYEEKKKKNTSTAKSGGGGHVDEGEVEVNGFMVGDAMWPGSGGGARRGRRCWRREKYTKKTKGEEGKQ